MVRKDVAFKIRIDEELRRTFVEACREQDLPAAQVVREFMRRYVAGLREPLLGSERPARAAKRARGKRPNGKGQ